jgi:YVTN family beta-propeller protein
VVNSDDNTVSVIDTAKNEVIATITVGENPHGIAVTPDGKKLYVTNSDDNTVSEIDATTNTVIDTVGVGKYPFGVVVTPDGKKIYVASNVGGTVSVINIATDTVESTLNVGSGLGVAIASDGAKVYIANEQSGTISIIDTATDTVSAKVKVEGGPYNVAVTPDGTKAYVANGVNVCVVDMNKNIVTTTIKAGESPYGVAVTPDGTKAYVTDLFDNNISVIDTTTDTITTNFDVGSQSGNPSLGQFIGTCLSSAVESSTSQKIINQDTINQDTINQDTSILDTTTFVTSSNNQYASGQQITLNAMVETSSKETKKPSGTVIFMDGTTCIGMKDVISGQATLTASSLSTGSHSITAKYYSDSNKFNSSTSAVYKLMILDNSNYVSQINSKSKNSTESQPGAETTSTQNTLSTLFFGIITAAVGGIIVFHYGGIWEKLRKNK